MSTFRELALAQRSCRRFDPDAPVADADLLDMLNCAVHAPSAENSQPWEFVVVRDRGTRLACGALVRDAWNGGGSEYVRSTATAGLYRDVEQGIAGGGFDSAPVMIVVCVDLGRVAEQWAAASIYPATQNLLLAAASLGYGSCLTTALTTMFTDRVTDLLGLPAGTIPMACVFLGRPARPLGPPRREPAAGHTHRERFGQPW